MRAIGPRTALVLSVVLTGGCTSLFGIDGDYVLEEEEQQPASGPSSSSSSSVSATSGGGAAGSGGADATCDDGVTNGDESDQDCGGGCAPCARGEGCVDDLDCVTQNCAEGLCECPAGRTGGDCSACREGFVACGSGVTDVCIEAVLGVAPLEAFPLAAEVPVHLAADCGDDNDAPTYGLLWKADGAPMTFAHVDPSGVPVEGGELTVTDAVDARAIALHARNTGGFYAVVGDEVAEEGLGYHEIPQGSAVEPLVRIGEATAAPAVIASFSDGTANGGLAFDDAGSLTVTFYQGPGSSTGVVDPEGASRVALDVVASGAGVSRGIAYTKGGALWFARVDELGGPTLSPPAEVEGASAIEDAPIFLKGLESKWIVGATRAGGSAIVTLLHADGTFASELELEGGSNEMETLLGDFEYAYAFWGDGGEAATRPTRFVRLEIVDDALVLVDEVIEVPRPELFGNARVVSATTMSYPNKSGVQEIGLLQRITGSESDDGLYLARIATCPIP